MEPNTKLVVITLILALTLTAATGQNTCGMTIAGLYACKPYVQTKNPLTTAIDPLGACCSALSKADFPCLCKEKNKFNPFLSGIDFGLAAKLPEKFVVALTALCWCCLVFPQLTSN
ncbi:putative lipid-transfer protein DIR1 [Capsella rubella]|uniref:putative lipid-transfer protein DIR1 n=1 Tax=Capsella rubella TaxID=81985 RepID=UPI000CD4C896|nr:putative lipid-transfer protein DIR1 [Capsella rubella]